MCADEISNLAELLPISDDRTWWQAECRGDPEPDRWFPFPSEGYDYATDVCNRCPIVESCREFASATGQTGIWGRSEVRAGQDRRGVRDQIPGSAAIVPADTARHRASWSRSV